MTRGVLYVAMNEGIQVHLEKSVRSLHHHCPDLPITIVTNLPKNHFDCADLVEHFQPVLSVLDDPGFENVPAYPDFGYYAKVKYFYFSPYEETLFLDHDTYVLGDINEIFTVLEDGNFHFIAAHDVGRQSFGPSFDIPMCFPTFNTGVVCYRQCIEISNLVHYWWALLKELHDPWGDQPTFMKAVYDSPGIRFGVMPKAYNYRFWFPQHAYETVKILHGRAEGENLEEIGASINKYAGSSHFTVKGKTVGYMNIPSQEMIWL
jgi:hypothetical protein